MIVCPFVFSELMVSCDVPLVDVVEEPERYAAVKLVPSLVTEEG